MTRRKPGELLESQFQAQVVDLAAICGFYWLHVRPGRTMHGWSVPISGPLGAGWPDLVLVRPRDRRLLFVELKRNGEQPSPEQVEVLDALRCLDFGPEQFNRPGVDFSANWRAPRIGVHVWRPADMDSGLIPECLR
jgi:hypothetical protein